MSPDPLARLYPKWNCQKCGDWFHMPYKFCNCDKGETNMTEPKTLTPQEALRALADGQKIRYKDWKEHCFLVLSGDMIIDQAGVERFAEFSLSLSGCVIYTEPKPKRKVAPYYVDYKEGTVSLTDMCFETDAEAQKHYGSDLTITRCMVLEREF